MVPTGNLNQRVFADGSEVINQRGNTSIAGCSEFRWLSRIAPPLQPAVCAEVAGVIERHENNDQSAQQIDALETNTASARGWPDRVRGI
jgi:hypothetical protein